MIQNSTKRATQVRPGAAVKQSTRSSGGNLQIVRSDGVVRPVRPTVERGATGR